MADKWAVGNGNWSATGTWNDSVKPGVGDDVYADGFTVTIDEDPTVLSVRTTQRSGGTAGGGFTLGSGRTLTCTGTGVVSGTTICVIFSAASPNVATINANSVGGSGNNRHGITNTSSGTLNVNGNMSGGNSSFNSPGVNNNSTGTVNVVGNVTGGSAGQGVNNAGSGTLTITGDVAGGSQAGAYGVHNAGAGTVAVTGNVTGGSNNAAYGVNNNSTGVINITGDLIPATGSAVYSVSTGRIYVEGNLQSVASGRAAYGGGILVIHPSDTVTHAYRSWDGAEVGAERVLSTASGGSGGIIQSGGMTGGFQRS